MLIKKTRICILVRKYCNTVNIPNIVREFYHSENDTPTCNTQWGCNFHEIGFFLYMAIEAIRENLPFVTPGIDFDVYSALCQEIDIEDPYHNNDAQDIDAYHLQQLMKEKHAITLESKGHYQGFKLEVRSNKNCAFNSIYLFCRDFMSLLAWLNKKVIVSPYNSVTLNRYAGSLSSIKEVRYQLPYTNMDFF